MLSVEFSSAYHLKIDVQIEVMNHSLGDLLRFLAEKQLSVGIGK